MRGPRVRAFKLDLDRLIKEFARWILVDSCLRPHFGWWSYEPEVYNLARLTERDLRSGEFGCILEATHPLAAKVPGVPFAEGYVMYDWDIDAQ